MGQQAGTNLNRGYNSHLRGISLSGIEEKINMPDIFKEGLTGIDAGGFPIFQRDPGGSILKTLMFGVPLVWIAGIGFLIWLIKKR